MTMEWILTAPWEPDLERRGDALGLGNIAEDFANILAPDLSNRTRDARWISILSWCLCMSENAPWRQKGSNGGWSSDLSRSRYEWIQPLELMWIYRTYNITMEYKGFQLPGIRTVKKLVDEKRSIPSTFDLSDDQLHRYRFIGIYGSYRTALRFLPGLTENEDGWTPGEKAKMLAAIVSEKIKFPVPESISAKAKVDKYWRNQWQNWRGDGVSNRKEVFLPQDEADVTILPKKESEILGNVIFGADENGKRRKKVVETIAKCKAVDHKELCEVLSPIDDKLKVLAPFADLTESALAVLSSVWRLFCSPTNKNPTISLDEAVTNKETRAKLDAAKKSAVAWNKQQFGEYYALCSKLAEALSEDSHKIRLKNLIQFHSEYGAGLHWMCIDKKTNILPLLPTNSRGASPYRYRLWQLCRLAVQCGVLKKMPDALKPDDDDNSEVEK